MLQIARSFVLRIGGGLILLWLAASQSGAFASESRARFDQPALDAMIAPIALYPDQLLTQVLMAASYPQEIEEAARWSRARPGLSGDAAVRTAAEYDWDPSVRSLTAFPQVLDTMARHMEWTEDLGNAFIDQPHDVMDTVQRLRLRAYEAGTLTSSEYTRVINTGSALVIESVQPQVVYIPHYDSRVVYGPWWWPARPPMYWPRWRSYHEPYGRPSIVHWGPGVSLSGGFFFGGFDWPRREVRVINTRPYYYAPRYDYRTHTNSPQLWQHDHARREAWRNQARSTNRPPQAQQRARQEAPATRPVVPREARPQPDGEIERRAMRRRRDSDGENDTRPVNPGGAARSHVNPAPQQPINPNAAARGQMNPVPQPPAIQRAPAPQPPAAAPRAPAQERVLSGGGEDTPRMSSEERRSRAERRGRD